MPSGGESHSPVVGESIGGAIRGRPRSLARNAGAVSVIVAIVVIAIVIVRPRHGISGSNASPAIARPPVAVASVARQDLPVVVQALGTVTPLSTVTVKSQISGYLADVYFKEGKAVKRGDLLAQIDERPYRAALAQYQGQLTRDEALLRNAQLDLARYQRLMAQDSTSHQTVDTALATVSQYEGTVQSDRAQVDLQKLNLNYCRIVSPTNGRLGLRQVDAGNYVQGSDTGGLVVITQLQPISVIFILPQSQLGSVLKRFNEGATLPVIAYDSDNLELLATGALQTVDNQIDTSTGTVKLRATFGNENSSLFPNQFVNARLVVDTLTNALTVPTAAIQRGAAGTYVYRVGADDVVAARPVKTGLEYNGRTAILSGLASADRVVTDGIGRLNDGMKVTVSPAASASP
jgi:membrane fusion protein, multidrug efflux system